MQNHLPVRSEVGWFTATKVRRFQQMTLNHFADLSTIFTESAISPIPEAPSWAGVCTYPSLRPQEKRRDNPFFLHRHWFTAAYIHFPAPFPAPLPAPFPAPLPASHWPGQALSAQGPPLCPSQRELKILVRNFNRSTKKEYAVLELRVRGPRTNSPRTADKSGYYGIFRAVRLKKYMLRPSLHFPTQRARRTQRTYNQFAEAIREANGLAQRGYARHARRHNSQAQADLQSDCGEYKDF